MGISPTDMAKRGNSIDIEWLRGVDAHKKRSLLLVLHIVVYTECYISAFPDVTVSPLVPRKQNRARDAVWGSEVLARGAWDQLPIVEQRLPGLKY